MMILLLAALYALLLPLGFGVLLLQLIRRSLKHYLTDAPVSVLTYWLGGTALLTALLECWSFAGPIHTAAHVAAAGMGLLGLLQPEGRQLLRGIGTSVGRLHVGIQLLGVLLTLCAFMLSTLPPFNVDTAIYHAQALRWLEEVGIVPGLANVDIHLGFNSAWFVPEALFSWGRYWGSPLQVLNSVFFVLFGWYGLGGLNRLVRGQGQPVDALKALLVIMMTFWLADDLPSLSPDPAATLIVFGIITQALGLPLPADRPLSVAHAALLLIIVFAVTLKLSTLPVLLLGLWWLVHSRQYRNGRFLAIMAMLGAFVALPWFARNYVISGYPVFPSTAFGFMHPDWQFPVRELTLHNIYIRDYARIALYYDHVDITNKPLQFWLPIWWQQQYAPAKALLAAIPLLLLVAVPLAVRQYRRRQLTQGLQALPVLATTLGGLLFWFVLAPAVRFGFGFLLSCAMLLLLPLLWETVVRFGTRPLGAGLAFVLAIMVFIAPMMLEYRHFHIPDFLSPAEYADVLKRLPDASEQRFVQTQFQPVRHDTIRSIDHRSPLQRVRLVVLLSKAGEATYKAHLDEVTHHSSLLDLSQHLVFPTRYPVVAVQPVAVPPLRLLYSNGGPADFFFYCPFYAAFPYTSRPQFCRARGTKLADGFVPREVSGVRNWRHEARW
jgi:hypothetical protein